jgi:protein-tyrosine-phosphatase
MKVLFVCQGNAHRSALAEALLKNLRPDWSVDSAGVRIAIPVSEHVREYLKKEGAEKHLKRVPESLDSKRLEEYDIIVAMEQRHKGAVLEKCSACRSKVVVWGIEDPYFLQGDAEKNVYDQIKARTEELARSKR